LSERGTGSLTGRDLTLLALAFFGIFVYGLISALMFLLHLALTLR
jgi:hypothetical protein